MVLYSFVQNSGEAEAWDEGKRLLSSRDFGENGAHNRCGRGLGGEVAQGLYRSPVVEGPEHPL